MHWDTRPRSLGGMRAVEAHKQRRKIETMQSWTREGRPELHRRGVEPVPGPWMNEPDKVQWVDEDTDLDCLANRGPMGNWCGYVGVPPGHPLHGKDYDEVYDLRPDIDVHGSLTFAGGCDEDAPEGHGICHIPLPGRPDDVWWLGFDCGHGMDVIPYLLSIEGPTPPGRPWGEPTYKTLAYVQFECRRLARQLAEIK